jgi:homoserine dehydrogenase
MKYLLYGLGAVGEGLMTCVHERGDVAAPALAVVKNPFKLRQSMVATASEADVREYDGAVEATDDASAAFERTTTALRAGKFVVSSNKKMIAERFTEWFDTAMASSAPFLYEAACCAAIPVVRLLDGYYAHERIEELGGIFNGTTNFILTQIFERDWDYDRALAEAQNRGFAESDPTLDVNGTDTAHKLCILAVHAMGLYVPPNQILRYGIPGVHAYDVRIARERGRKLKLLAVARHEGQGATLSVLPTFVAPDSPYYSVGEELNAVGLRAEHTGPAFWLGKGAGGVPTGGALLADVRAAAAGERYRYVKYLSGAAPRFNQDAVETVYVRYFQTDAPDFIEFLDEPIRHHEPGAVGHYVGKVKVGELIRWMHRVGDHPGYFFARW